MSRRIEGKRVLVTGGAGFIGSNLCETLLAQDNEVISFDNYLTGKHENLDGLRNHPHFMAIDGDIRDMDACKHAVDGVDIVLHQAALGSVPRSIEAPLVTNDININGFLNMIEASRLAGVKRFVYAASSSTYGDSKQLPKQEDNIGNPLSPYAVTKRVAELYAKVYSDLYGIETVGLRYFNVFGRKQDPNGAYAAAIPLFISSFMKYKSPTIHGDGSQTRDFTYIDNVIQANELAATVENPEALNTVYNVAFGEETILKDLVVEIRSLLSQFDERIAEVEINYGEERRGDVKYSLASIDKAKTLLGYDPQFSPAAGLKAAIEWYWENLKELA